MTTKKLIENARQQLKAGNVEAYKKMMYGLWRSSMSTRTSNQIANALRQDGINI